MPSAVATIPARAARLATLAVIVGAFGVGFHAWMNDRSDLDHVERETLAVVRSDENPVRSRRSRCARPGRGALQLRAVSVTGRTHDYIAVLGGLLSPG